MNSTRLWYGGDFSGGRDLTVVAVAEGGTVKTFKAICRIDTPREVEYYRHGGILQYVARQLASAGG